MPLKLLIIDAYSPGARARVKESDATHAGELLAASVRVHDVEANIDIVDFDADGAALPQPLENYGGVLWTGSNMTIHRLNPMIEAQIDLCRNVYDTGVPQFGICWGLQMGCVAAGGEVQANPKGPEIAWARGVTLTEEGRAHPFTSVKPETYDALCWHSDAVTQLPEGATLLATNDKGVQAAIFRRGEGEFWATQYHLEYHGNEVAALLDQFRDYLIESEIFTADGLAAMQGEMRSLAAEGKKGAVPEELRPVVDPLVRSAELGAWLGSIR